MKRANKPLSPEASARSSSAVGSRVTEGSDPAKSSSPSMPPSSNPLVVEKPSRSGLAANRPKTPAWRLLVLLLVLIALGLVAYRQITARRFQTRIEHGLASHENHQVLIKLDRYESKMGRSAQTSLWAARAYRRLKDRLGFERELDQALTEGATDQSIQNERLLQQAELGLLPDLASQMGKLMENSEEDFEEAAMALTFGLLAKQEFGAAVEFLLVWESQAPDSAWIPTFRGMMALSRRDWQLAQQILEPAMRKHSEFVPLYLHLGTAYNGLNDSQKAVDAYLRYLESVPEDGDAALKCAAALKKEGRIDEAVALLTPWVDRGEASIEMRLLIAKERVEQQDGQGAIALLQRTAELWPEDVAVATTLSQAYQQLGDEPAALRFAEIADAGSAATQTVDSLLFGLLSNPNRTAQECYKLGHLLLHKQSRENGVYWLEAALRIDERFEPAHRDLLWYYTRTDQPHLAAVHQRYLQAVPDKP